MPRKNGRKTAAKRRTYFKISAPEAANVQSAGTFNAWEPEARKLRMDDRGVRKTSMMLEPGVYEYRFVVDGGWSNDPESARVPNPYGCDNCIRVVE
jgi:1,4-alpha-glucan branching enzyme